MKLFLKKWMGSKFFFLTLFLMALPTMVVGIWVIQKINIEWDFTDDKRHTLSPATELIINDLEKNVVLNYYVSKNENIMPTSLRGYASRVEHFLQDLEKSGAGKIKLNIFDPEPDTQAEDSALIDEITGQTLTANVSIYHGLSINSAGQRKSIPFLNPVRESNLEYDVVSLIKLVGAARRPQIGILPSLLPLKDNVKIPSPYFLEQMRERYNVVFVESSTTEKDFDLLILWHPKPLTLELEEIVVKHLHNGGSLLAFFDPAAFFQRLYDVDSEHDMMVSGWPDLMSAMNIEYKYDHVLADLKLQTEVDRGGGKIESLPYALSVQADHLNQDNHITANLNGLHIPYGGGFLPDEKCRMNVTRLINSSEQAYHRDAKKIEVEDQSITLKDEVDYGKSPYIIAGLFEGEVGEFPNIRSLPEKDARVIIMADTDFISDPFIGTIEQVQERRQLFPNSDNYALAHAFVEFLLGDSRLDALRKRTIRSRPLVSIQETQKKVEERYRERIEDLIENINIMEGRIQNEKSITPEIENNPDSKSQFVSASLQRQEKIKQLSDEHGKLRKELRELRNQQRLEVNRVQSKVKWLNSALMPCVFIFFGVSVVLYRKKKTGLS